MFSSKKSKYKKFLLGLLEKGQLEESDESKLNDFGKQLKLNEDECGKIRDDILFQEAKSLIEYIAESKMFGFEQEKTLKRLGNKHRIELDFADEFKEYRENWLAQKQKVENNTSSNQEINSIEKIVNEVDKKQKSNASKAANLKTKNLPKFNDNMTVDELVSAIESVGDLQTLERKSERLEEKYQDTNNSKYENYQKNMMMLLN